MEFKRIYLQKNLLILIVILLAINIIFYIKEQTDSVFYDEVSIADISRFRKSLVNEYQSMTDEDAYDLNTRRLQEIYTVNSATVISKMQKQLEYIIGFSQYIGKIEEQAKSISGISIFNDNASFTKRNIDKTVKDFQKIKNLSLEIGNDEVLLSITKYKITQYLVLIFYLFYLLDSYMKEKKDFGISCIVRKTGAGILQSDDAAFYFYLLF